MREVSEDEWTFGSLRNRMAFWMRSCRFDGEEGPGKDMAGG